VFEWGGQGIQALGRCGKGVSGMGKTVVGEGMVLLVVG